MAEVVTKTYKENRGIVNQCDIFRNLRYIECFKETDGAIEISQIVFPLSIVLTQACDLQQDFDARDKSKRSASATHDKFLVSVIVAPIYNFEEFRNGTHLSQLNLKMAPKGGRNKSLCQNIIQNENKRYHYLNFEKDVQLSESVVDFKHYYTINVQYLNAVYKESYVCSIDSLYRELILQRFSNFLGRIGLPD